MKNKAFKNSSSFRSVFMRDIMLFLFRPILRTATLRNDEAGVKAFTLIELLVVVLIIGILAAIALPQYEKAVYKSRLAEAMINIKAIENCFDEYVLTNGLPTSTVYLKDMGCSAELSGGEWDGNKYKTKYFEYNPNCSSERCFLSVQGGHLSGGAEDFVATAQSHKTSPTKYCYTNLNSKGRVACQMLQEFGYEYHDAMD